MSKIVYVYWILFLMLLLPSVLGCQYSTHTPKEEKMGIVKKERWETVVGVSQGKLIANVGNVRIVQEAPLTRPHEFLAEFSVFRLALPLEKKYSAFWEMCLLLESAIKEWTMGKMDVVEIRYSALVTFLVGD